MRGIDVQGQRFGRLTVLSVGEPYRDPRGGSQKRWKCECDCGRVIHVSASDLTRGKSRSCGCARPAGVKAAGAHRRREWVSYFGMHARLNRDRGRAKGHPCADCGEPASSWSYDGTDPSELYYEPPGKRRLAYSLDQHRYFPRCAGCHNRHDGIEPPESTRLNRGGVR